MTTVEIALSVGVGLTSLLSAISLAASAAAALETRRTQSDLRELVQYARNTRRR